MGPRVGGWVDRGEDGGVGSAPSQATTKNLHRWLCQREPFTAFLGKSDIRSLALPRNYAMLGKYGCPDAVPQPAPLVTERGYA